MPYGIARPYGLRLNWRLSLILRLEGQNDVQFFPVLVYDLTIPTSRGAFVGPVLLTCFSTQAPAERGKAHRNMFTHPFGDYSSRLKLRRRLRATP